jgi:NADPH-dependent 2,4-dienoyl-CoA reductase/sulfur reductase-like enzyme/rhodanese-related sulfurtransferase
MSDKPLRIVIIGGVAAGMSAATRARRINEAAQITVLERGGFVSFANCGLPYHVAGRIAQEEKLLITNPTRLKERFNIDVRLHTEAVAIDLAAKVVRVWCVGEGGGGGAEEFVPYDKLILAPGASAIVPAMEGLTSENVFTMRSMEDTRALQAYLAARQPVKAVVVGAGFIGLEMVEALHDRGMAVTVVEKAPHVLPPMDRELAVDIEHELAAHHVEVITGCGLGDVQHAGGRVTAVVLEDGRQISADVVILSIGVRPNVELARAAGLTIGPSGGIAVDQVGRTNDPEIYAAGDVAEVVHGVTAKAARVSLAGPANRAGRRAGEHAAGSVSDANASLGRRGELARIIGTAIVQVFALEAGVTGLSEATARAAGFNVDTAYITANHHAGYYPGAASIRLKLVYDRGTGRVLGAQAVGRAGVDKRLDVIATVLHFGGTIDDLAEVDLAYAPQFGSAKDPVHMAAFVAQNQRSGLTPAILPCEISGRQLVDVRTVEEFARGHLPQAIHIPVDVLRQRVGELDASKPTAVICQSGLRAHVAVRMLKQKGFADVVNVKGGWELARRM